MLAFGRTLIYVVEIEIEIVKVSTDSASFVHSVIAELLVFIKYYTETAYQTKTVQ